MAQDGSARHRRARAVASGGVDRLIEAGNQRIELKASYGPEDVPAEHARLMGAAPGQPPFHRGGFPQGYRTKPWRIFQLSGFGKPEDENERIKFLLRKPG